MARKKNVTFNDIAQYTHFSKTTISRYFNNPDSLTPENQQIISDALDKLNYKENKVAKILANGQTEFVGVLIPSLSMNYYSEMLNQILASYEKYKLGKMTRLDFIEEKKKLDDEIDALKNEQSKKVVQQANIHEEKLTRKLMEKDIKSIIVRGNQILKIEWK